MKSASDRYFNRFGDQRSSAVTRLNLAEGLSGIFGGAGGASGNLTFVDLVKCRCLQKPLQCEQLCDGARGDDDAVHVARTPQAISDETVTPDCGRSNNAGPAGGANESGAASSARFTSERCSCGSTFLEESRFCQMCGAARQHQGLQADMSAMSSRSWVAATGALAAVAAATQSRNAGNGDNGHAGPEYAGQEFVGNMPAEKVSGPVPYDAAAPEIARGDGLPPDGTAAAHAEGRDGLPASSQEEVKLSDGRHYVGHLVKGEPEGHGKMMYPNGDVYEGAWVAGHRHGEGVFRQSAVDASSTVYRGQWRDGLKDGIGVEEWGDGSRYEGEFRLGEARGSGAIVFPSGLVRRVVRGAVAA
mmetsp:Transcript_82938/g.231324  ORF Transcript_82938/g.231324 Transcript_82938/m.231324 type:complete len:359 (-) Transcript_82938:93-1169(-)